jgi:lactate racemase
MRLIGQGAKQSTLRSEAVAEIVDVGLYALAVRAGARILAIVPDNTRSFEPAVVHHFLARCRDRQAHCDILIANGTHAAMSEEKIDQFLCRSAAAGLFRDTHVYNHSTDAGNLSSLGTLGAQEVADISCGRLERAVEITVNKRIFDYDLLVIIGPVFPHEVVGMSGGWKYFFPGISGVEVINQSHWLGALLGIHEIIGRSETPVRSMVEKAGALVEARKTVACLSLVLRGHDLHGLYFGDPVASHRAAAALSQDVNILWTGRRYRRVVAECPVKYDELWTGGKLAYKTQEVVEQGGEIVMYAPHLDSIAPQHPDVEKVGYHSLAYFLAQWDRFKDVEPSSIAHSTHVAGPGAYEEGEEVLWARRTLASRISPAHCASINLDYLDPAAISFVDHRPFGDADDTLWVPQAGEQLFMCEDMRGSLSR